MILSAVLTTSSKVFLSETLQLPYQEVMQLLSMLSIVPCLKVVRMRRVTHPSQPHEEVYPLLNYFDQVGGVHGPGGHILSKAEAEEFIVADRLHSRTISIVKGDVQPWS